jgi:hypothetical protein
MFGNSFDKAFKSAEGALSKWHKVSTAIDGEQHKLLGLIPKLLETDAGVRHGEAEEVLEGAVGAAAKARKQRDGVHAEIDHFDERLRGLRGSRAQLAQELADAHDKLTAAMPEYHERIKQAFRTEWEQGCAILRPLLARRRQLEFLIGEKLVLPEPAASADVGESEAALPQKRLDEIAAALAVLNHEAGMAGFDQRPGGPSPYGVFVLRRPTMRNLGPIAGLPEDSQVVAGALAPGELRRLFESRWAAPVVDVETQQAGAAARKVLRELKASEVSRETEAERANRAEWLAEQDRLHPEFKRAREGQEAEQRRRDQQDAERGDRRPWVEANRRPPARPPAVEVQEGREAMEKLAEGQ